MLHLRVTFRVSRTSTRALGGSYIAKPATSFRDGRRERPRPEEASSQLESGDGRGSSYSERVRIFCTNEHDFTGYELCGYYFTAIASTVESREKRSLL